MSTVAAKVVDDKSAATYRWAGSTLQIQSEHAQRALHQFCCNRDASSGVYAVGGEVKDRGSTFGFGTVKPREICLVSFADVEPSKKRFASVTSVHAFSAQPKLTAELNALLYASDVSMLAKEMWTAQSTAAQLYQHNRGSAIHCGEVNPVCSLPMAFVAPVSQLSHPSAP